jgi:uncharacterized protein
MDPIVHFEIPADETGRAQAFYQSAFGWKVEKYEMPDMEYYGVITTEADPATHMPKNPGQINGGMLKREGVSMAPVITISVKSVDESIKKIEAAGGTIVKAPYEIGGMGIAAYFKDTEGNVMGLWQDLMKK